MTESKEVATKQASPAEVFRGQLEKMEPEFKAALPDHIPVDRFKRVVLTAVNQNQDLFGADRRSLFQSCTQAAQDGLLPDGREAAFVIFKTKDRASGDWIAKVQYMPMIAGILKKVRNSSQLSGISANVVYAGDDFDYELGDNERIYHKPNLANRGAPIAAYAIAHLKDGTTEREVMTVEEINQVREVSRAKDKGPWVEWWGEMARKTVMRRLSKRLPMSSDLETLLHRDDTFYKLDEAREAAPPPRPVRPGYVERISQHPCAAETVGSDDAHDAGTSSDDAAAADYTFVDWQGGVYEYGHHDGFVMAFKTAIKEAPTTDILSGLFDTNDEGLERLKKEPNGEEMHQEICEASGERYKALTANGNGKKSKQPAETLV